MSGFFACIRRSVETLDLPDDHYTDEADSMWGAARVEAASQAGRYYFRAAEGARRRARLQQIALKAEEFTVDHSRYMPEIQEEEARQNWKRDPRTPQEVKDQKATPAWARWDEWKASWRSEEEMAGEVYRRTQWQAAVKYLEPLGGWGGVPLDSAIIVQRWWRRRLAAANEPAALLRLTLRQLQLQRPLAWWQGRGSATRWWQRREDGDAGAVREAMLASAARLSTITHPPIEAPPTAAAGFHEEHFSHEFV